MAPKKISSTLVTLKPGDKVLAKFDSFPYWPCIVVADVHVPDDVKANCLRAHGSDDDIFYIHFVEDGNWGFVPKELIKPLSDAECKKGAATKSKKQKAFIAVRDCNDYWKFLVENDLVSGDAKPYTLNGLKDKKPTTQSGGAANRKRKIPDSADDTEATSTSPAPELERPTTKKRRSLPSSASSRGSKAEKPGPAKANASETKEDLKKVVYSFRFKLQRKLLQTDDKQPPSEEMQQECSEVLKELEDFSPQMTTDLLRYSKLHKVLKAIIRVPELKRESDLRFHERSMHLLFNWEPYLRELKTEKERDTPNSSMVEASATKVKPETTNGTGTHESAHTANGSNGTNDDKTVLKSDDTKSPPLDDATNDTTVGGEDVKKE